MITTTFYLSTVNFFFFLFSISLIGMFLNKKNILIMLMSLEMLFLSTSFFFIFSSIYLDDITKFGLVSATRNYKVGIASNRK